MIYAYFFWNGDILYSYGVAGLVLYPFRKVRTGWLLAAGLLMLTIVPAKSLWTASEMRATGEAAEAADAAAAAGQKLTGTNRRPESLG